MGWGVIGEAATGCGVGSGVRGRRGKGSDRGGYAEGGLELGGLGCDGRARFEEMRLNWGVGCVEGGEARMVDCIVQDVIVPPLGGCHAVRRGVYIVLLLLLYFYQWVFLY